MICPFCSQSTTNVTNSRPRKKTSSVWRRRQCRNCHRIFSTSESVSLQDDIRVVAKTLDRNDTANSSPYNRGVLLLSIADSFAHNPTRGREASWWLTETIEASILTYVDETAQESLDEPSTVHSSNVSALAHEVLGRYDRSAAIQYAARHGIALA